MGANEASNRSVKSDSDLHVTESTYFPRIKAFHTRQTQLNGLAQKMLDLSDLLEFHTESDELRHIKERVSNDTFKVLVVGEFNSGKSTLINALLEQHVLPTGLQPTTAVMSEIKWAEIPRAVLYYRASDAPVPVEVPIDKIQEHIIVGDDQSQETSDQTSRYEKLELYWPLELCKNSVEIIDSPGLNDNVLRQQTTLGYVPQADIILFVLRSKKLGSQSELEKIERWWQQGYQNTFFVCNQMDQLKKEKDQKEVRAHAQHRLAPLTTRGADHIFFVSAKEALEGRLENDSEKFARSGFRPFEQELDRFLVEEKGPVKIKQAANYLNHMGRLLERNMTTKLNLLDGNLADIQQKAAKINQTLQLIEREIEVLNGELATLQTDLMHTVQPIAEKFFADFADSLPAILDRYVPSGAASATSVFNRTTQNGIARDLEQFSQEQMGNALNEWHKSILTPLLSRYIKRFSRDLEEHSRQIIGFLADIEMELSSNLDPKSVQRMVEEHMNHIIQRQFGIRGFSLDRSVSHYVTPGRKSIEDRVSSLALGVGGVFLAALAPVLGTAAVIIGSLGYVFSRSFGDATYDRLVSQSGENIARQFRAKKSDLARQVTHEVGRSLSKLEGGIQQSFTPEVERIRHLLTSTIDQKQADKKSVDELIALIQRSQEDLCQLKNELHGFSH